MAVVACYKPSRQVLLAVAQTAPVEPVAVPANDGLATLYAFDTSALSVPYALAFHAPTPVGALETQLTFCALGAFGPLGMLPLDALRPFGSLETLAFRTLRTLRALHALALDALRTFGTFETLAFDSLRTFRALKVLALCPLRTFGPVRPLPLCSLRTFGTLETLAFRTLRALGTLTALCFSLAATLARFCASVAIAIPALRIYRAGERHRSDTGNQEKLASHYNLLAQSKLMDINRLR